MRNPKDYEIIDFHTHPFMQSETNICSHKEYCNMSADSTVELMRELGVSKIAGSVIGKIMPAGKCTWSYVREMNDEMLSLWNKYGDFYIPGFHVHPHFVRESCEEIEAMSKKGIKLIGELVPYWMGWKLDYGSKELGEILDVAEQYNMVVSFHSMWEDAMDKMVREHPGVVFVAAHPGEYGEFSRHMERMKLSENYYLDTSGYGIFRHGMLRHAVDMFGAERFIFGSDYPTCNPAMYLGGVALDPTITDSEAELILSGNAKRILGIE